MELNNQMNYSVEYLKDEVSFVRQYYISSVQEIQNLERYSVVIIGAIWSWCATNLSNSAVNILVWIPFISTSLFGIRAWGISYQVKALQRYLSKVEDYTQLPEGLGWEKNRWIGATSIRFATGYLFWVVLNVLTICVALYVTFNKL